MVSLYYVYNILFLVDRQFCVSTVLYKYYGVLQKQMLSSTIHEYVVTFFNYIC